MYSISDIVGLVTCIQSSALHHAVNGFNTLFLQMLCIGKNFRVMCFECILLQVNTLRTGNFLLKIFHRSLIRSEVPFTIRRKAPCIV
jgi:hypothetical protein